MDSQILHGRYDIQQQLSKKAGRQTLLARDEQTQERVVVKILSFNEDFSWDDLKLFEREVATLQALSHPAIPRYLDSFELDSAQKKGFALVQTYIEAQSLDQCLQAGRSFSEAEVKQIARDLLGILTYLHGRQPPVIHRDIKPSNVLLGDRSGNSAGQVYLVDFGSVQTLAPKEASTFTVVGTYGYMPPEQFGGRAGPASDLYSLGATLIYLVTGKHPADFPQDDLRIEFEAETNLSVGFTHWLQRMVQPSLKQRFTSAEVALTALDADFSPLNALVKHSQPIASKVTLLKDAQAIEVIIPPTGVNVGTGFLGLFAIAWNSFLVAWTGGAFFIPFPINVVFLLFSLPFWGVGVGMVVTILFSLFGRTRLRIDPHQISLVSQLFGFRRNHPKPLLRQHITKLEYMKKWFTKDSDGSHMEIKPQIVIWAGTQKYELGGNGILSEPELDWLAQELSEWLGLPIVQNQP